MILKTLGAVASCAVAYDGHRRGRAQHYPQTWSQIAHDLSNPNNPTYAPTNQ